MDNENTTQDEIAQTVEVNIGAVAMACRIIAAATERGAIKAEELSTVGQVFDYLRGFLPKEAQPQQEEGVSAEETTEEIVGELEPEAVAAE